jgi:prepilin peptidase CpaA
MGAGDVKLLAGVGAWVGSGVTFYAFCLSAIVGGVIAVAMVVCRRGWTRHKNQFLMILNEIATVGSPSELATIAAERKSSMLLLPYGIPIAIGTILYFFWAGMLV